MSGEPLVDVTQENRVSYNQPLRLGFKRQQSFSNPMFTLLVIDLDWWKMHGWICQPPVSFLADFPSVGEIPIWFELHKGSPHSKTSYPWNPHIPHVNFTLEEKKNIAAKANPGISVDGGLKSIVVSKQGDYTPRFWCTYMYKYGSQLGVSRYPLALAHGNGKSTIDGLFSDWHLHSNLHVKEIAQPVMCKYQRVIVLGLCWWNWKSPKSGSWNISKPTDISRLDSSFPPSENGETPFF